MADMNKKLAMAFLLDYLEREPDYGDLAEFIDCEADDIAPGEDFDLDVVFGKVLSALDVVRTDAGMAYRAEFGE